jgi:DNA polymerase-3 subunit epsilon
MSTIYLDTETTGLAAEHGHRIVELAIVDDRGVALMDTLVDPRRAIPADARAIHGITQMMVRGKPTLEALLPEIGRLIRSSGHVVIYNATFDTPFLPAALWHGIRVDCAMRRFAELGSGGPSGRWQRLEVAAERCGHVWSGAQHRALADALAARTVWRWCQGRREGAPPTARRRLT